MLVIALVLVLFAVGCAVLVTEASRDLVPIVGPNSLLLTSSSTPAPAADQATAPVVPTQRTSTESTRAAATYGFIADLPAELSTTVQVNL